METTISDILWVTMQDHYKSGVQRVCREYETDSKYTLKKIFENGELVGFGVWYMLDDYRVLEGGYYLGKDKTLFLKMWREFTNYPKLKALVHRNNTKMVNFYKKMKFKIEKESLNEILFIKE